MHGWLPSESSMEPGAGLRCSLTWLSRDAARRAQLPLVTRPRLDCCRRAVDGPESCAIQYGKGLVAVTKKACSPRRLVEMLRCCCFHCGCGGLEYKCCQLPVASGSQVTYRHRHRRRTAEVEFRQRLLPRHEQESLQLSDVSPAVTSGQHRITRARQPPSRLPPPSPPSTTPEPPAEVARCDCPSATIVRSPTPTLPTPIAAQHPP